MNNQAKTAMILNQLLERSEVAKVEELDIPISERFASAGLVARLCKGDGAGDNRSLIFYSDIVGITKVGSMPAKDFLRLPPDAAVSKIALAVGGASGAMRKPQLPPR